MEPPTERDERLDRLVDLVVALASGRLDTRLTPSPASDAVDAVIVGLNMLGEELSALYTDLEARITERTAQLEDTRRQLEHLALHDPLTGLANRTVLADRIGQALAQVDRGAAVPAVLVLDLDGFKAVNDSFGHAVGDALLVEVAQRLRRVVRRADTVARLGGDEFAIVVEADPQRVLLVAERVLDALRDPVEVAGHSCWATASIGVRFAVRGQDADLLLRDADTAMYAAKAQGKGRYAVYEPAMHTTALSRVRVGEQLRRGLTAAGELVVHYQLIMDLSTGRPAGVEALVRWNHPERGPVAPGEFVEIAEHTGLIAALGELVRETAIAQLTAWRATVLGPTPFAMHINTAPLELRSPHFAADVLSCLHRHTAAATDVVLEITETQMLTQDAQTLLTLDTLRSAGVGIAIDDFGTGYSSLGSLRHPATTVVKIDRSLVSHLDTDPAQHRVTAAILALAHAFDLLAVAEGVETQGEAAQLRSLGCRQGQGWLWGRATAAATITPHLRTHCQLDTET